MAVKGCLCVDCGCWATCVRIVSRKDYIASLVTFKPRKGSLASSKLLSLKLRKPKYQLKILPTIIICHLP